MAKKKNNQKPLTLEKLAVYNKKVLLPTLERKFVTKTEFIGLKTEVTNLKTEVTGLKTEFTDFKNESLTNQDKMLKKLDILLTEKKVREYQRLEIF